MILNGLGDSTTGDVCDPGWIYKSFTAYDDDGTPYTYTGCTPMPYEQQMRTSVLGRKYPAYANYIVQNRHDPANVFEWDSPVSESIIAQLNQVAIKFAQIWNVNPNNGIYPAAAFGIAPGTNKTLFNNQWINMFPETFAYSGGGFFQSFNAPGFALLLPAIGGIIAAAGEIAATAATAELATAGIDTLLSTTEWASEFVTPELVQSSVASGVLTAEQGASVLADITAGQTVTVADMVKGVTDMPTIQSPPVVDTAPPIQEIPDIYETPPNVTFEPDVPYDVGENLKPNPKLFNPSLPNIPIPKEIYNTLQNAAIKAAAAGLTGAVSTALKSGGNVVARRDPATGNLYNANTGALLQSSGESNILPLLLMAVTALFSQG